MDFVDLYHRYAQDVFRFAFYLSGNRTLAEDIAAETFARALTARTDVNPGSLKAYLFAIARNLFLDGVRVDLDGLRHALLQLPEHERAALIMATVGNVPHDEIAAALGTTRAAVKVRIHHARLRLCALTGHERTQS